MEFRAGTVGFAYKQWRTIYPQGASAEELLTLYSAALPAVEIGNTFYRIPRTSVVRTWAERSRDGFVFSVKASRHVTHVRRLGEVDEPLGLVLRSLAELGDKLGPILFQLPPTFAKDASRLRGFLKRLPAEQAVAFEFRHRSWFCDEIYDVLRERNVAFVTNDMGSERRSSPFVSTADWGYVRLLRGQYTDDALAQWARRIREQRWRAAFAFVDAKDDGPVLARKLLECMQAVGRSPTDDLP